MISARVCYMSSSMYESLIDLLRIPLPFIFFYGRYPLKTCEVRVFVQTSIIYFRMATSSNGNKRIRRSSTDSNNAQLYLSDLPSALLPKVASFLSNTSCISFTRAMTQNLSSLEPSILSKSIMTASLESWDTIDFKDVQDYILK